jgi:hypothetical protein
MVVEIPSNFFEDYADNGKWFRRSVGRRIQNNWQGKGSSLKLLCPTVDHYSFQPITF